MKFPNINRTMSAIDMSDKHLLIKIVVALKLLLCLKNELINLATHYLGSVNLWPGIILF